MITPQFTAPGPLSFKATPINHLHINHLCRARPPCLGLGPTVHLLLLLLHVELDLWCPPIIRTVTSVLTVIITLFLKRITRSIGTLVIAVRLLLVPLALDRPLALGPLAAVELRAGLGILIVDPK